MSTKIKENSFTSLTRIIETHNLGKCPMGVRVEKSRPPNVKIYNYWQLAVYLNINI